MTGPPPLRSGAASLVDRLRHFQKVFKGPNFAKAYHDMGNEFGEAADEIERLRAQVVAQTTDNPITRAVGWWEGPMPDRRGRVDDAEVMRLWRECGLPEYFLGNGGSNHKLVAFANACGADEIERLREALQDVTDHLASVMDGPMVRGAGIEFKSGVEGIPTIARARAVLAKARGPDPELTSSPESHPPR